MAIFILKVIHLLYSQRNFIKNLVKDGLRIINSYQILVSKKRHIIIKYCNQKFNRIAYPSNLILQFNKMKYSLHIAFLIHIVKCSVIFKIYLKSIVKSIFWLNHLLELMFPYFLLLKEIKNID